MSGSLHSYKVSWYLFIGKLKMRKFDDFLEKTGIERSNGFDFYFKNYIFNNIDIDYKKLLDLGGGNGMASFYALSSSASCSAWIVDPIAEGSNDLMWQQYNSMKERFDPERVNYHRDFIETLVFPETFDIILMHNTINHIGEDILKDVLIKESAYVEYKNRIKTIVDRLKPGGFLIVADCGTKNFLGNLGLKNPLAPSIDWKLHCDPEVWQKMIEEIGCSHIQTNWTARREFGFFGKKILANRLCAYFLNSHFVSKYQKKG